MYNMGSHVYIIFLIQTTFVFILSICFDQYNIQSGLTLWKTRLIDKLYIYTYIIHESHRECRTINL